MIPEQLRNGTNIALRQYPAAGGRSPAAAEPGAAGSRRGQRQQQQQQTSLGVIALVQIFLMRLKQRARRNRHQTAGLMTNAAGMAGASSERNGTIRTPNNLQRFARNQRSRNSRASIAGFAEGMLRSSSVMSDKAAAGPSQMASVHYAPSLLAVLLAPACKRQWAAAHALQLRSSCSSSRKPTA